MTACNWDVLFALKAGVSLKFDKESVGVNEILCIDCEDFNGLGVSKSTSSELTQQESVFQFNLFIILPSLIHIWTLSSINSLVTSSKSKVFFISL